MVIYFDPQPVLTDRGAMASPFSHEAPHELARRAAAELRVNVGEGKMFGVLVVVDRDGRVGYLRGFSGMLRGSWHVEGFVGPAFDETARAWWPAAEAGLGVLAEQIAKLERAIEPLRRELDARHARERAELEHRHGMNRERRREQRGGGDDAGLDRESQRDTSERKAMKLRHVEERVALSELERERALVIEERAARSREYLQRLHASYVFANARGETKTLRELFAPAEPPGGAGDCAAPKLFAHAYREGLRPIALAEVWRSNETGSAPFSSSGRTSGQFYPACRGKCGPILAHVLEGLAVEPAPVFATRAAPDEPRVVFEDAWILVVDKPAGMLSVPGRGNALQDSAITRLRARFPDRELSLVHRLDLDTSGLLLVAKDAATHADLQARFAQRVIDKRYIAILDGVVSREHGTIDLPLRLDVDDRPRQIVDYVHGKRAITEWRVLERSGDRTRVAFLPRTGRTHQLRVHAAVALGVPIAGDRLYGRSDGRLLLHAEALAFDHPHTGARVELVSVVPF